MDRATGRWLRVVLVVVVCLAGLPATVGAIDEPVDGSFVVELDESGDAELHVSTRLALDDEEQRTAFDEIDGDEEAKAEAGEQFLAEMRFVADVSNDHVDREMNVSNVTVAVEEDGDVGVVTYTVQWENLAAVESTDDEHRLTVSEPFSIYDELDRELVVVAPEGYELTSVTPEPAETDDRSATWPGLTDLSDFEVVAERTDSAADTDEDGAGFGIVAGVVAILLSAGLLARRRAHVA